ncbi:aldolase/citrate lyase family protein [Paraburkholderia sp. USG1]|uniref:HpcH/HpaI aldolase family protein n=1 Tax=Paraburkholderia sp. USG1 TaxID=2952268 RepID=UPI002866B2EC|nr:aldolase/citrate lyase family protein [Paraburkholderia sp. USG1]MDR8402159.1 aldolase/citrate lyase family protein [Paraburkholderia sp. USG1]
MTQSTSFLESTRVGVFVKTDSPQIVEILALTGLDFVVLDAEHAPLGPETLDRMLFAGNALGLPTLVRIPDHRDAGILSVLDMGATGIVVPHVDTPEQARNVVAAARFIGGRRGISLSARFGGYGTLGRADAIASADRSLVVCQIESREALDNVEAIAAVRGVAALLIGRSDLALSMGQDNASGPVVMSAVQRIMAAAHANGLPVVMVCANVQEGRKFQSMGATSFVVGSDQSLLRNAASQVFRDFSR